MPERLCGNCDHPESDHVSPTRGGKVTACTRKIGGTRATCPCTHFDPYKEDDDVDYPSDSLASTALTVVSMIEDGSFDPYIELLLTAGHTRKLVLRGVRGFPRERKR